MWGGMLGRWAWAAALSVCGACSSCDGQGGAAAPIGVADGGGDAARPGCLPGAYLCDGELAFDCDDPSAPVVDCGAQGKVCTTSLGCAECAPFSESCRDGAATWCRDDGTLVQFECDETQGMRCEPEGCSGACALPQVSGSYIGCDYYPTVTPNPVWSGFAFAVAVSNASARSTAVTVTRGDQVVHQKTVAAGELAVLELPWVDALKRGDVDACQAPPAPGASAVARAAAYRLRTDEPVTVYQFSPLRYQLDPAPSGCPVAADCPVAPEGAEARCLSYSNDASLLLPATALTGNYSVVAWPSQADRASFVTVTATEDGTSVSLSALEGFARGDVQSPVRLDRGDVLQLLAEHGAAGFGADASGLRVRADRPVQVIAGNSCAHIPEPTTNNCDHVEHVMPPEDTLGSDYFVSYPSYVDGEQAAPQVVRVLAIEDDTRVTFQPEVAPPVVLSPADGPYELVMAVTDVQDLRVTGDKPLLVVQFMEGQGALPSGFVGDPSMALVAPREQWRSHYLFTAPEEYIANFINVVAPAGAQVTLDGSALPAGAFAPIGDTGWSVARHMLSGGPVHTLEADREVGLLVYGYGLYTSYMYPGGMDLERITLPPIL